MRSLVVGLAAFGVVAATLTHCTDDGSSKDSRSTRGGDGGSGGAAAGGDAGASGRGGDPGGEAGRVGEGGGSAGGTVGGETGVGGEGGLAGAAGADGSPALSEFALAFDGVDDRVVVHSNIGIPSGNAARTVEMWVYARSTSWAPSQNTVVEYGGTTVGGAFGIDMDRHPNMRVYTRDVDVLFDTGLPPEGWFHVAATYDGARTLSVFINGQRRGSVTVGISLATSPTDVTIGGAATVAGAFFDGMLDEIRIWNVARSEAQLRTNMRARVAGSETGLAVYLRLEEGSGTVTGDDAGQNGDAVLDGAAGLEPSPVWVAGPSWAR